MLNKFVSSNAQAQISRLKTLIFNLSSSICAALHKYNFYINNFTTIIQKMKSQKKELLTNLVISSFYNKPVYEVRQRLFRSHSLVIDQFITLIIPAVKLADLLADLL